MPFSLKNVAQTFQRALPDFRTPSICEILQQAATWKNIFNIFNMDSNHSKIMTWSSISTMHFWRLTAGTLGHTITATGISPLTKNVDLIQQFLQPTNIKELQQFPKLVSFYRRFIQSSNLLQTPWQACQNNSSGHQTYRLLSSALNKPLSLAYSPRLSGHSLFSGRCISHTHLRCPPTIGKQCTATTRFIYK
jgi:hypothetical protein